MYKNENVYEVQLKNKVFILVEKLYTVFFYKNTCILMFDKIK